eukprot:12934701-Alexandrium_andersonii.AAC.1
MQRSAPAADERSWRGGGGGHEARWVRRARVPLRPFSAHRGPALCPIARGWRGQSCAPVSVRVRCVCARCPVAFGSRNWARAAS